MKLPELLEALDCATAPVVVGFDGFVDEMVRLVAKRTSLDTFEAVPDIAAFGALVSASAGHSSLREIVVHAVHPGGCAVNLGDGLAALGIPVDCYATLGEPVHPAFQPVLARFRKSVSWGREPGRTIAFEFADGKMMFSSVRQLADFSPAEVASRLADGAYAASCREARVIALTDWTLFPHMTGVWELLAERVFANLEHRPYFFIDLVDPSGRSRDDILAMARVMPSFEKRGPVCLGLNGNEANILARIFSLPEARDVEATENLAARLRDSLGISRVVVHRPTFAVEACEIGVASKTVPLCETPAKSTGAGDRFNAGYILGLLSGCEAETRLQVACAVSGFFVRNGHSPSRSELKNFLRKPPVDS